MPTVYLWASGADPMLDVLLPAAYFCDLVFTGLPDLPKPGEEVFAQNFTILPGGGFIPAVALTRLGVEVGWACDFGDDFFSRYTLEESRRQGLDERLFRTHARPLQAVAVAYSFAHDRAFLSYIDPLPPMDLAALVKANPARCLMLMSFQQGPEFLEAAEAAHALGSLVFMDGQVAGERTLSDPQVIESLQAIDVFSLNLKEALYLTGAENAPAALARLAAYTPTVVIKLGADGALANSRGTVVQVPGIPAEVLDTTGAGDNFDCGFLYGLLRNDSLEDCLRCGNFCGSRSTTAYGGWGASPTAGALEQYRASVGR